MSKRPLLLFSFLTPLATCSLLEAPTGQPVQVVTDPPAASCELMNDRGRATVAATPGKAVVPVGRGDLTVTCQAPGFEPAVMTVENFARNFVPEQVVQRSLGRPDIQPPSPIYGYPDVVRLSLTPAPEPEKK